MTPDIRLSDNVRSQFAFLLANISLKSYQNITSRGGMSRLSSFHYRYWIEQNYTFVSIFINTVTSCDITII